MAKKKRHKHPAKRANYLRRKRADGKALSAGESEWLAEYELGVAQREAERADASAQPPGDSDGEEPIGDEPSDGDDSDEPEPESDAPTPGGEPSTITPPIAETPVGEPLPPPMSGKPPPPPPKFPKAPKLPAPPRVNTREEKARDSDWRAKYQAPGKGGDGREATCTFLAGQWVGALKAMTDAMKAANVDPVIEPELLRGSIILALDEMLPDKVKVTPKIEALAGTTMIVTQRFLRRKEIAEAQDKLKQRVDHAEFRKRQAEEAAKREQEARDAQAAHDARARDERPAEATNGVSGVYVPPPPMPSEPELAPDDLVM